MADKTAVENWWRGLLTGEGPKPPLRQMRYVLGRVPSVARCKFCSSPFDGPIAPVMRVVGRGPSRLTSEFCHACQVTATQFIGGAEVELSMLFADVRGSTSLAEGMTPSEFSALISRFFGVAGKVLLRSRAWVDRLAGDQVVGMYLPFYVGHDHENAAIRGAQKLLRSTGHDAPDGPWVPLGVGIHSGVAFVGTVGSADGATDITVLGDAPNVAARLSSAAGPGEILISEDAFEGTGISSDLEKRTLELKGKSELLPVRVLKDYS